MLQFTDNPFTYQRFLSREVLIGNTALGGNNPVRIQSMCSTNTMDTMATVAQSIRMIEAGCEYVRITAPGVKEAENLAEIKNELYKRGYTTPLIADIHFNPKAAEVAASIVEKVRINPGNYIDRNIGKYDFNELEYKQELERIAERLFPLIEICKRNQTAIRIGTNHGSLSNRILSRYGDTPNGMVESAMEFIRILSGFDFYKLVLSMKSSNVKVMIASTRLLVASMINEGYDYPIHLGVTEAGDAEDGRIKSAAGIGALLHDGIGDTIRVSLTEEPEFELPVAHKIVKLFGSDISYSKPEKIIFPVNPYQYARRKSIEVKGIGGNSAVIIFGNEKADFSLKNHQLIHNNKFETIEYKTFENIAEVNENSMSEIHQNQVLITHFKGNASYDERKFFAFLQQHHIILPVIVRKSYNIEDKELFQMKAAADLNALLVDGYCDGIWIENPNFSDETITDISFAILQTCGVRISRTEFISCPSCGRTQFKIIDALKTIKEHTSHLKGLKIAVMGCIVNGPGEMADAHYGYVGAGNGLITLYKGKAVVKKNIPEAEALDKLIELIKSNGDWKEHIVE
ncbi:MAG: (E)-4-hydroxy-3-methylbut-2-enyl-diphosphate synthase [Bacteroidales bacterium]